MKQKLPLHHYGSSAKGSRPTIRTARTPVTNTYQNGDSRPRYIGAGGRAYLTPQGAVNSFRRPAGASNRRPANG